MCRAEDDDLSQRAQDGDVSSAIDVEARWNQVAVLLASMFSYYRRVDPDGAVNCAMAVLDNEMYASMFR